MTKAKKPKSRIIGTMQETMSGLHRAGVIRMDKKSFSDLVASIKEMKEVRAGKRKPGRTFLVKDVGAKVARKKTVLSPAKGI